MWNGFSFSSFVNLFDYLDISLVLDLLELSITTYVSKFCVFDNVCGEKNTCYIFVLFPFFVLLILHSISTLLLEGWFSISVLVIALVFSPGRGSFNVTKSCFKTHPVPLKTE